MEGRRGPVSEQPPALGMAIGEESEMNEKTPAVVLIAASREYRITDSECFLSAARRSEFPVRQPLPSRHPGGGFG